MRGGTPPGASVFTLTSDQAAARHISLAWKLGNAGPLLPTFYTDRGVDSLFGSRAVQGRSASFAVVTKGQPRHPTSAWKWYGRPV